jgi:hypothetical protein
MDVLRFDHPREGEDFAGIPKIHSYSTSHFHLTCASLKASRFSSSSASIFVSPCHSRESSVSSNSPQEFRSAHAKLLLESFQVATCQLDTVLDIVKLALDRTFQQWLKTLRILGLDRYLLQYIVLLVSRPSRLVTFIIAGMENGEVNDGLFYAKTASHNLSWGK